MQLLWKIIAWILCRDSITTWIIRRTMKTPYWHILSPDGSEVYMGRWWLFNPYVRQVDGNHLPGKWSRAFPFLPSIRLHHILQPDLDRHLHDHPWNARTIVLKGWYNEVRPVELDYWFSEYPQNAEGITRFFHRSRGYTGRLNYGEYHQITKVADDGAWTLFLTWKYQGVWGYMVDGQKVPSQEYLKQRGDANARKT